MPNLTEIGTEIASVGSGYDVVRRKYLGLLSERTGRNVILYYSGWLQKRGIPALQPHLGVNDGDKNGFMATIHQLDRSKGLDLVLHTPGGDLAATESLVDYLRQMFGTNIRAFVPQLAMSAGTMIALACNEIFLGKHSNLGPIDPQIGGMPAYGVLEEFGTAAEQISGAVDQKHMQALIGLWQPIIAKYSPTLIGQCQKAIRWASEMTTNWLETGMFHGESDANGKAVHVTEELSSHAGNKTHARHIHRDRLIELGIKVTPLEDDQELQDLVLSLHHACIDTLNRTAAIKLIENQNRIAYVIAAQMDPINLPSKLTANDDAAMKDVTRPEPTQGWQLY